MHCWNQITSNFISFFLYKDGIKPDSNYPVKFLMRSKLFLPPLSVHGMQRKTIYALTLYRQTVNHCVMYRKLAQPRVLLVDISLHQIKSAKNIESFSGQKVSGTSFVKEKIYYHDKCVRFWLYLPFRIVKNTLAFQQR